MLRAFWGPVWGGVTVVLIGAAAGLGLANGTEVRELGHLIHVAACAVVGGLISHRRPGNAVGRLLLVSAFSFAAMDACGGYAIRGEGPLAGPAGWPQTWLWVPANLALILLPLYFPDGRLPGPRWRPVVVAAVGAGIVTGAVSALRPGVNGQVAGGVPNPYGVAGFAGVAGTVEIAFDLLISVLFFAGVAVVVARARRAEGEAARPFKWLAYAAGLSAAGVVGRLVIGLTDGRPDMWPVGSLPGEVLGVAAMLLIPVAIAIAILRHGLFDIDLLISRTLVYATLTACVVGGYVLVVNRLGALFEAGLPVSLLATGVIALVFAPLRERVQQVVHRLMYGQRGEPYAVLTRLGRHLEGPEATAGAARAVAEALRLPYVAVEVSATGVVVAHGKPSGDPVSLPLAHNGRTVGRLLLSPRPGERELGAADLRLLQDLAGQIAVAVHLQQSREELVTAREEERRRLRRELHDGLGPTLASLTMRAEAVQELLDGDPERARTLLEEIVTGTETAIGEVRRLVDGLRPPALDTLGLGGALQAFVDGRPPGGPRIRLARPDALPPLGAAAEVAAYRIATEAVTNVWRHAHAEDCLLVLSTDAGALTVQVSDNGRGAPAGVLTDSAEIPSGRDGDEGPRPVRKPPVGLDGGSATGARPDRGGTVTGGAEPVAGPGFAGKAVTGLGGSASGGVGLESMRERAVELGGVFTVESVPGRGTTVRAVLPLGA
ncbi:GAF domain-containing sensor histidine kinase [Actinocorallia populi]|uniref:GAF domain-containing sensor histidine kinase n=1 Tax=Actinocorallia populi TaxID=2079200 RepID=UPI0013003AE9|nr:histidine kinase [Actinocorallia populi]